MKAHRIGLAIAAALTWAAEAGAQSAPSSSSGEWVSVPGERHLVGRLQGGIALNLNDAWGAGALAPPWIHAQGAFLFLNPGGFRMGPSLGAQLGIDAGRSGLQGTVQAGWFALRRFSSRFALTGRLDASLALVRGANVHVPGATTIPDMTGMCPPGCHSPIQAPFRRPIDVAFGMELGVGAAVYLTAGFALTGELNTALYFGDSFYTYPLIGVGLGAMIDLEFLP